MLGRSYFSFSLFSKSNINHTTYKNSKLSILSVHVRLLLWANCTIQDVSVVRCLSVAAFLFVLEVQKQTVIYVTENIIKCVFTGKKYFLRISHKQI